MGVQKGDRVWEPKRRRQHHGIIIHNRARCGTAGAGRDLLAADAVALVTVLAMLRIAIREH